MTARRLIGALALLAVSAWPALAQPAAPGDDEIYIENVAPQQLTFGLSEDNETWDRFELAASESAVFGGSQTWYFLILTDGVELRYRLDPGGSYRLYWNDVDLRWDAMTCTAPACGRADAQ